MSGQANSAAVSTGARPQVDTPWRKASGKLEGDSAYEALDKLDRIEVYQEYIRRAPTPCHNSVVVIRVRPSGLYRCMPFLPERHGDPTSGASQAQPVISRRPQCIRVCSHTVQHSHAAASPEKIRASAT